MTWDRDRFDLAYQERDPRTGGRRPSYRRAVSADKPVWQQMVDAYKIAGLEVGQRALIVGCGFGWTVERMVDQGFDAWGTDTSPWINSAKASEARSDIRQRIRPIDIMSPAAGSLGHFDWAFTELVLDSLTEADTLPFLDRLEQLADNVGHAIIPAPPATPDPALGLRELDGPAWIATRSTHSWLLKYPDFDYWHVAKPDGTVWGGTP